MTRQLRKLRFGARSPRWKGRALPGPRDRPQRRGASRGDDRCSTHPPRSRCCSSFSTFPRGATPYNAVEARLAVTSNFPAGSRRPRGPAGDRAQGQRLRWGSGLAWLRGVRRPGGELDEQTCAPVKIDPATASREPALCEDGRAGAAARLQHPPLGGPAYRYHHLLRGHDSPLRVHPAAERQEAHPGTSLRQVSSLPSPAISLSRDLGQESAGVLSVCPGSHRAPSSWLSLAELPLCFTFFICKRTMIPGHAS